MNVLEGKLTGAEDIKIGIVAARFNEFIVSRLIGGALDGLKRHDVPEEQIDLAWVPGAFEIPVIHARLMCMLKGFVKSLRAFRINGRSKRFGA